jgi:hypothetical protein
MIGPSGLSVARVALLLAGRDTRSARPAITPQPSFRFLDRDDGRQQEMTI